jgi:hypothetical protein
MRANFFLKNQDYGFKNEIENKSKFDKILRIKIRNKKLSVNLIYIYIIELKGEISKNNKK